MILENLKAAGIQQAHKEDRITFTSLTGWPGNYICAEGDLPGGRDDPPGGRLRRPRVRPRLAPRSRRRRARASRRPLLLRFRHHVHEAAKKVAAVARSRRGLGVVLDRK